MAPTRSRQVFAVVVLLLAVVAAVWIVDDRLGWSPIPTLIPVVRTVEDPRFANTIEQVSGILAAHRAAIGTPALSVAVAVNGRLVWAEAVGWADVASRSAATPETRFRIGSTSKTITVTVTGRLMDRGVVALDVPISSYDFELPKHWQALTLRQLHSHTAGITDYEKNTDWLGVVRSVLLWRQYDDVRAALEQFDGAPLQFKPGAGFLYSSFDVNLASAVLQSATDEPFLALVERLVTQPLGMGHTHADYADRSVDGRATFYERRSDGVKPWRVVNLSSKWASGGFVSTSTDLVELGLGYLHGDFLAEATVQALWTPQVIADGSVNAQSYALGWRSDRFDSPELGEAVWRVHHGGVSKGAMSWLAILPELDFVIALNSNSRAQTFDEFRQVYLPIAREFTDHRSE